MKRRSPLFAALFVAPLVLSALIGFAQADARKPAPYRIPSSASAGATQSAALAASPSTVQVADGANGLTAAVVASGASAAPVTSGMRNTDPALAARVDQWMGRVGWIPNRGQIVDDRGHPAPHVLFSTTVDNTQIYVTTTGLSHYFLSGEGEEGEKDELESRDHRRSAPPEREVEWCRVDAVLAGADIRPERARFDAPAEQGVTNYYLAHCPNGVLDVPTYDSITFPDVYPGIDWVVKNVPSQGVHQDFVVHPGADASRIRLDYAGQSAIEASSDGQLLRVRTRLGEVREGALACSQDGGATPVTARFRVRGSSVSLELGAYDRTRPLVIDPPLQWATFYGGLSYDGPRTIYCDNTNNFVYVIGYTGANDMPVQNPGGSTYYQGTYGGGQDAFIWKFTQQGVRLWATYYGGSGVEYAADGSVDPAGNLYVGGYTLSTDLPTQNKAGAYNQAANAGGTEGFLLEFDVNGVRQWATYWGGAGADQVDCLTTDAGGRLFVGGVTTSANFPVVNPGGGAYYAGTPTSSVDAFVSKFSAAGVLQWSTYFGGNDYDDVTGIYATGTNLYVSGFTQSVNAFPVMNSGGYYQPSFGGGLVDAFIGRFTIGGAQTWTTYYGGTDSDYGDEVAVDPNGNLFVFGDTWSTDFPVQSAAGAYNQSANGGDDDFYLLKFGPTDARLWATYYGGNDVEFVGGSDQPLALDAAGNVYVTGMTNSTNLPVLNPGGFFQGTASGMRDAVIGHFTNAGAMVWSTYLGSDGMDFGTGIAVGGSGCVYATGENNGGVGFPMMNPGAGAWYQPVSAGYDDGFIVRFCSPPSSCCSDNNCIPVFTQAQCTQLGGQSFFPNQPCSTTVCTIDCKICGTKYNDLNRNGVRDGGEPGLSGWTIQLMYPNGSVYATATTDGSGNYCFNGIPCGAWKVNEVMQPGWVQRFPSPLVHTLSMGTGQIQNGVDFGNYQCGPTPPCPPAPPRLVSWWPFGEAFGATTASDVTHLSPPRNVAERHGPPGAGIPDAICFFSDADYARVPVSNQLGLEFADGSFSIAAWINVQPSSAGPRVIVEKRMIPPGSTHTRGWSLYLVGQQSFLELGNGDNAQIVPGPDVAAGDWHHLAVAIDRRPGALSGHWYLDGVGQAAFDFMPVGGLVSSNADVYMGRTSPAFGASPPFLGCIGDLELLSTSMTPADAAKAIGPGPGAWCPEAAVLPAVTTICQNSNTVQVCFNLCNYYATPQSYHWSLAGLPAGPGCTVAGPTVFSPNSGTVTVAAGQCSGPICVTITRPPGMTAQNATACYQLNFINDATGICRVKTGTLRNDNTCWCATPIANGMVPLPPGGTSIAIGIKNPCPPIATLAYAITPVWLDPDHDDPHDLRLNGLPPGEPVIGTLTNAGGGEQILNVNAAFGAGDDFARKYEIILEADTDGDGVPEPLASTIVRAASYDSVQRVSVPGRTADPGTLRLVTRPNPFMGGTMIGFALPHAAEVSLGVYDLSGRLVRSLQRGKLAAGEHRFDWNGRDDAGRRVAAGIYFVGLDGRGVQVRAKVVKLP